VLAIIACGACCAAAVPSFLWSGRVNLPGRLAGVAVFVVAYVIVVHTSTFARAWARRRVRRAVVIGYAVRAGVSAVFPIGMFLDLWPGMLSAHITGLAASRYNGTFAQVFATTVIQGILLHGPLICFILLVYAIVPASLQENDDEPQGHAFEVIPIARATPAPSGSVEAQSR
jgi:hypothetical protein